MTQSRTPLRLYRHALSGHSHRAELFLSLLGLPVELVEVDLMKGEHKKPEFLQLNRFAQVPVLKDDDLIVADSCAILVYLARRYDESGSWWPSAPAKQAEVVRWFSLAQGPLLQGPGRLRLHAVFGAPVDRDQAKNIASTLFERVEAELGARSFLLGVTPTLADVALYTYTAHAPEGGVSLRPYPGIRGWLARIQALPGFVPMRASETPLLADASA